MRVQGKAGLHKNLVSHWSELHTVHNGIFLASSSVYEAAYHLSIIIIHKVRFSSLRRQETETELSQPRGRPEMETFQVQDKVK